MPIYEYERPDGTTFELHQGFDEEPLSKDPETGVPVRRVLHPPAVHFKGSGFYNTDYGTRKRQREQSSTQGAAESKPSTDAAGDSAGKSESKASGESSGSSSPADSSKAAGSKGAEKSDKATAQPAKAG